MSTEEALAIEYDRIRQIERHATVELLREMGDEREEVAQTDAEPARQMFAAYYLRKAADRIENGDHRR